MVRSATLLAGISAASLAVVPFASAVAQGAAPNGAEQRASQDEDAAGGDIVVTAQKRSESIRDVPMSITALSGDQLAARGVIDTADLAKVVSGFTFNTDAEERLSTPSAASGFRRAPWRPRQRCLSMSTKFLCHFR